MQDFSTISICLSADENYIWHLFETIWSIRKVSMKRKTDVYVMLDCNSEASYEEIAREAFRLSTKTMTVIPMNVNKLLCVDKRNISVTKFITFSSYVRIFLPELLPGIDKILWLDCDLVVLKPLDEFWDVDVTERYAAAVDDFTMEHSIRVELSECRVNRYFNAGVMLFNLKKIRETGINKLCKERMYGHKPRFQDQTVLNSCYGENIVWLAPRFNLHYTSFSNRSFQNWSQAAFGETYRPCSDDLVVIAHYTGIGTKPWDKNTPFYYDEYVTNSSEVRNFVISSAKSMFTRARQDLMKYEHRVPFHGFTNKKSIPEKQERNIVVCMTSYPQRINGVPEVVKNMLSQTIVPDNIIVTLSRQEFPMENGSIPPELRRLSELPNVTINWVDPNTKTMKKVFPALGLVKNDSDLIVIVDDDITYNNDFIEKRLDDFYKFGERFGISSNDNIETSVGTPVSGAGSMMEKKMLADWDRFADPNVIRTYEDDWAYMFILKMNGYYFVACSDYPKSQYAYKKMLPSKCYETSNTIKVMSAKFANIERGRK